MGMVKAIVWEHADGRLTVSTDIWPGDDTVDLPPKIYESYMEALNKLQKMEQMIRNFTRIQERQRTYSDD